MGLLTRVKIVTVAVLRNVQTLILVAMQFPADSKEMQSVPQVHVVTIARLEFIPSLITYWILHLQIVFLIKLKPVGTICRQADNECDLTELCTGFSGECPQDLFVKNTVECKEGQSFCFNGRCPTMNDQCKLLWGHKSEPADDACFLQFNMGGTASGNCGTNKFQGGLRKCERE